MKSLFMLGFAAWVLGSAVVAFMNGTAPDGVMMGTIGGLALAANVGVAALLVRDSEGSVTF